MYSGCRFLGCADGKRWKHSQQSAMTRDAMFKLHHRQFPECTSYDWSMWARDHFTVFHWVQNENTKILKFPRSSFLALIVQCSVFASADDRLRRLSHAHSSFVKCFCFCCRTPKNCLRPLASLTQFPILSMARICPPASVSPSTPTIHHWVSADAFLSDFLPICHIWREKFLSRRKWAQHRGSRRRKAFHVIGRFETCAGPAIVEGHLPVILSSLRTLSTLLRIAMFGKSKRFEAKGKFNGPLSRERYLYSEPFTRTISMHTTAGQHAAMSLHFWVAHTNQ